MDNAEAIGLLILGVHLAVLVWAINNKQPWWALGIFFFPLVGDIAYAIYYFSTRETLHGELVKTTGDLEPGDTVTARARLYDSHGHFALKKGEQATVVAVDTPPKRVTVKTTSGKNVGGLRPTALLADPKATKPEDSETAAPDISPPPAKRDDSELRSQLEELARLHQDGLITEDEFVAKKRQVLGLE